MRVLRLVTRLNIGGPARQALMLSRELGPQFPTTLAAGSPPPEEGELSHPEVPVEHIPLVRPVDFRKDLAALSSIRSLIARVQPSLVHSHMAKAGALGRVAALTSRPRPVTVHTFHGHVLEGYFSPAANRIFVEVERFLARRTDMLLAVSPEVRDSLLSFGVGRPERFRVLPLGLDLSAFSAHDPQAGMRFRRQHQIPPSVPLIGMVGRLVPIKEVPTAFEALRGLPGAHLAVVGDGEERSKLHAQAREAGVADRVHFTGWQREVADAYAASDVVVLTSRNEGTPVSLIEAQASSRPVVATNVGGVRQVVQDGSTGYLVPAGDANALRSRVGQLLANPELREGMGIAGRERALARYGKERLVAEIAELYRELVSAGSHDSYAP